MKYSRDANEFLEELNLLNRDHIEEFGSYQSLALETLREVHKVCKKNDIDYYLAYGSLLGAIRHKGMIPWDYDIDIWVRGLDIKRFMDALNRDLPKKFYYVTRHKDKSCRHYIMRIAPIGYDSEVLHVDVYWLWEAGDSIKSVAKINKYLIWQREMSIWKMCDIRYLLPANPSKIIMILYKLKNRIYKFIPSCIIDGIYKYSIVRFRKGQYLSDEYEIFPKSYFDSFGEIEFNDGIRYHVPIGYKELLIMFYGDYNSILPIEDRNSEMNTSLSRLRRLAKLK